MLWHPLKLNSKRMLPSGERELLIPANNISCELCIFRQRYRCYTEVWWERPFLLPWKQFRCYLCNGSSAKRKRSTGWQDGSNGTLNLLCPLFAEGDESFLGNCTLYSCLSLGWLMDAVPSGEQRKIRTPEEQKEYILAILKFQCNSIEIQ